MRKLFKYKTNLTKKDFVVVLGCAVFLLINLGAIGSGGRRRAKEAVCLSNLRKWGAIFQMYTNDNNGYFFCKTYEVGDARGAWIVPLRTYMQPGTKLLFCPEATKRHPTGAAWGGPFHTYIMPSIGVGHQREECSYGFNCWLYNPQPGQTSIQGRPVEWNWKTPDVKGANNISIFADTMWRGGGPLHTNNPPEYDGQWAGYKREMNHFCINRHNGAVNHLFMDWSVRKVGLKGLWTLKWHRKYNTEGPWTKAGGVQPSDWPQWMRNFKDY